MKSISLVNFKNAYKTIQYSIYTLNTLAIIMFIDKGYKYFTNPKFLHYFTNLDSIDKNGKNILLYFKPFGFDLLHLCLFLLVLWLILWIIKKLPVPKSWIVMWVQKNELSTILGRNLASHFRWSNSLKVDDLMYYEKISNHQLSMLNRHEKLKPLFEKYDFFYEQDREKD
jgi:hypothetical protein